MLFSGLVAPVNCTSIPARTPFVIQLPVERVTVKALVPRPTAAAISAVTEAIVSPATKSLATAEAMKSE